MIKVVYWPPPPTPMPSGTYDILGVDARDAAVLLAVMRKVAGNAKGPRGAADRILAALRETKVPEGDSFDLPDQEYTGRPYTGIHLRNAW